MKQPTKLVLYKAIITVVAWSFSSFLLNASSSIDRAISEQKIYHIRTHDINTALEQSNDGYFISDPGTYIIDENIMCGFKNSNSFAITIGTSDVIIHGHGNTLSQSDTNIKHIIGIQIKEGFHNIQIHDITFNQLSGGAIWFHEGSSDLLTKGIRTINCGYNGATLFDTKRIGSKTPHAMTHGILFEGNIEKPIRNAQIIQCTFTESGISKNNSSLFESACSPLQIYQASDVIVKGCAIDGCVGKDAAWGMTLVGISNINISDTVITDIFSSDNAQGIYKYDIEGESTGIITTAIFSGIHTNHFRTMLETHGRINSSLALEDVQYPMKVCHIKGIIPKRTENGLLLFEEHTWKEFRTLHRLVCHNSNHVSKTSAIYAQWVELFCERVLGIKVKVTGGFANLYLTGEVPLPAHRDTDDQWIFGLSFGESRTLDFVADNNKDNITSFELEDGDIFIFSPTLNETHQHRILPQPERKGRRINLTYFLNVLPGQDCDKLLQHPSLCSVQIPRFEEAQERYEKMKNEESKRIILQDEFGNYYLENIG